MKRAAILLLLAFSPLLASGPNHAGGVFAWQARELAPGEPVRLVAVFAPQRDPGTSASLASPVSSVTGRFLGRDLDFVRQSSDPDGVSTWSAWVVVDLDAKPGDAHAEIHWTRADGTREDTKLTASIRAKKFPTETLKVEGKFVSPPKEVEVRIAREQALLAGVYARRTPEPPPAAPFVRPVPGEKTSTFGLRRVFNGVAKSPHPGLDLRAATGTPVKASGPGTVALAMDLYYSGNTVILDHGGGLFTIYAHLSRIDVAAGDRVEPGRLLGQSGATGRVTGPHLHWGGKIGDLPFDPTALLDPRLWENR